MSNEHDTERPPTDDYDPSQESTDVAEPVNVISVVQNGDRFESVTIDGVTLHNARVLPSFDGCSLIISFGKFKLFSTVTRD